MADDGYTDIAKARYHLNDDASPAEVEFDRKVTFTRAAGFIRTPKMSSFRWAHANFPHQTFSTDEAYEHALVLRPDLARFIVRST